MAITPAELADFSSKEPTVIDKETADRLVAECSEYRQRVRDLEAQLHAIKYELMEFRRLASLVLSQLARLSIKGS